MNGTALNWHSPARGIRILRLWQVGMEPGWPRVAVLDLTPARFREFEADVLAFDRKYDLYPEQHILWVAGGVKPPIGKNLPPAADRSSYWRVVILHRVRSIAIWVACPYTPGEAE